MSSHEAPLSEEFQYYCVAARSRRCDQRFHGCLPHQRVGLCCWANLAHGLPRLAIVCLLLVLWLTCLPAAGVAADAPVENPPPRGSLVILGGSERFNHREYWDEIVELAGGPGARIAVLPTASGDPQRKGGWVISALNKAGADAFLVPVA